MILRFLGSGGWRPILIHQLSIEPTIHYSLPHRQCLWLFQKLLCWWCLSVPVGWGEPRVELLPPSYGVPRQQAIPGNDRSAGNICQWAINSYAFLKMQHCLIIAYSLFSYIYKPIIFLIIIIWFLIPMFFLLQKIIQITSRSCDVGVGDQIYIILSVYCAPHVPLLKYWRLEKVRPVIFYFTQFTHTLTSFDFCSGTIQYYLFSFSRCAIVILVNCKSSLTFGWCFPLFSWPLPCHQWGRRRSAPENNNDNDNNHDDNKHNDNHNHNHQWGGRRSFLHMRKLSETGDKSNLHKLALVYENPDAPWSSWE